MPANGSLSVSTPFAAEAKLRRPLHFTKCTYVECVAGLTTALRILQLDIVQSLLCVSCNETHAGRRMSIKHIHWLKREHLGARNPFRSHIGTSKQARQADHTSKIRYVLLVMLH